MLTLHSVQDFMAAIQEMSVRNHTQRLGPLSSALQRTLVAPCQFYRVVYYLKINSYSLICIVL